MAHSSTKVRVALIDLSGTLHIEDQLLPGALEGVELLRQNGILLRFVTNTTKESRYSLNNRLLKLGLRVCEREMLTSLSAAKIVVERDKLRPLLFLEDSALQEFSTVPTDNFDSVVVGLAPKCFNHEFMSKAMNVLLDGGRLIAIHKARYYKASDGTLKAGPGCFVSGLEFSTGATAEVVGKPQQSFFQAALDSLNEELSSSYTQPSIKLDEVVMIGDDINDDVLGAKALGCKGILVRTGKYRHGDEDKSSTSPNMTCDSFADAAKAIINGLI